MFTSYKEIIVWKNKVVGQSAVLEHFSHALASDSLSHALILSGASGYGGLPIALALAQALLCHQPESHDACGQCKSCHHVNQLKHPDLHMAFPVVGKDGQVRKNITSKDYMSDWREALLSNPYISLPEWVARISSKKANPDINVAECNEISQQLAMQSFAGDRRVQIIWMSQYLGNNANKLLKLIEEPPMGTFIILLCDDQDQLLRTVVSRCRVIDIKRIPDHELQQALQKEYQIEKNQAFEISFLSEGDMGMAIHHMHSGAEDLLQMTTTWLSACAKHDYQAMRSWSEDFAKYNSEEQRTIGLYTLRILREILHKNVLGTAHCRLRPQDLMALQEVPILLSIKYNVIEALHQYISQMLDGLNRNLLARMLMFDTCLSIDDVFSRTAAPD